MSAYNGYLARVGDYRIPNDYINATTYKITRNTQDLDSYNDANGKLHRNALEYVCDKLEFTTPYLWDDQVEDLLSNIRANYESRIERRASVRVYVPEFDEYKTQDMYLSNPEVTIYRIDDDKKKILYAPIRICFIGYGVTE